MQTGAIFPEDSSSASAVFERARPVVDVFYEAVLACGCEPPFKPEIQIARSPGPIRYDHERRAVILGPYELLDSPAQAAMERFAAIGTLGLSGRAQYEEIFHQLLVAHELGHWLQMVAQRLLTRWQAEYGANEIMVAFWREHPAPHPAAPTEVRLLNFVAQPQNFPDLLPNGVDLSVEDYFDGEIAAIERNPALYAAFQKFMVRRAMAAQPAPSFRELVTSIWASRPR